MRKMHRFTLLGLAAAMFMIAGLAVVHSHTARAADNGKGTTVEGTYIDTKCYAQNNDNIGPDHEGMTGCGTKCAMSGVPVGILVGGKKGGQVVVVLAPSRALAQYIGQTGRATGTMTYNGSSILPDKLEIQKPDGKYESINFSVMM